MRQDTYTENLADFGARERKMAGKLLLAGLPEAFDEEGVKLAFNRNSGNVFLVNDSCQVAMMNGDDIELFYSTPYSGIEGFAADLLAENEPSELNIDDARYIIEAAGYSNVDLPANWQAFKDTDSEAA